MGQGQAVMVQRVLTTTCACDKATPSADHVDLNSQPTLNTAWAGQRFRKQQVGAEWFHFFAMSMMARAAAAVLRFGPYWALTDVI